MSLIKGLKNISEIELFDDRAALVLLATTCTNDKCGECAISGIMLTNDIFDLEYSYMTNLERICVFVRRVDIFNGFS